MKAFVISGLLLISALWAPAGAQELPETIEADVSTRSVAITSSFTGTEILVFGSVENSRQPSAEAGTYDVVVVVEGTPVPASVRKKTNVGGLWINTESVRFSSFPAYYAIASTRPIEEIADKAVLNQNQIGFEYVRMTPSGSIRWAPSDEKQAADYRQAAIRLKQKEGNFVLSENGGVIFIGRSLFRSTISLPPNVPIGSLNARILLFREGKLLSQYKSQVMLQRTGLERFLYEAAYSSPFLYGLATVLIAAAAGLTAAFAFSRRAI